MNKFFIRPEDTALLVIDIQERLYAVMEKELKPALVKNNAILTRTAQTFDMPVVVSEQYPKGLGPTITEMAELLSGIPKIEKLCFSCFKDEPLKKAIVDAERKNIVITGIETHVCVLQTVLDLLDAGYNPVVASDAVLSRNASDRLAAIQAMRDAGAVIYPTETISFMLLEKAGTPEFRQLSPLFK
ncbi:MAG TPA: hydrolase [Desulfomonilia bacterium]